MTIQTPDNHHTVDLQELVSAEVIVYDNVGMPATHRCDRCGAQAYVEAEVPDSGSAHLEYGLKAERPGTPTIKRSVLFCVHHYGKHEEQIKKAATRIIDHRPFLATQEAKFKGQP